MVEVPSGGSSVRWSVLDTGAAPEGTIVCVHGNPTWGYLWRDLLHELGGRWRVIAVDQTGMGWSERTGPRRLAERVDELVAFCRQETEGPIILVAHDWGGPVAMGAAARLDLRAVVLTNTAVAKPEGVAVPPLIATARAAVGPTCRTTPLFVRGTARMTAPVHREALLAPYRGSDRRSAVAEFVADIPLGPADPSFAALGRSAEAFGALDARDVPVLLLWGGRDPVFHDRFLEDLLRRAPHAMVHRFADAGHLVALDDAIAPIVGRWLDGLDRIGDATAADRGPATAPLPDDGFRPITTALQERRDDPAPAYLGPDGIRSWRTLSSTVDHLAAGLVNGGVRPGDRVALLVPPGAEMLEAAYGVWRAGGVIVVADSALGAKGLRRAFRGASIDHLLGTPRTVAAARALGFAPGSTAFCLGRLPGTVDPRAGSADTALPVPDPHWPAAVVHTSGATGPAKPVRYTHGALAAQRDVVRTSFGLDADHGFVSSFAPFILLGPALGVPCALPEGDILAPAQLDFDRFAEACRRSGSDVAWLSPASARTIVRTAGGRLLPLRLVMLAGAPIPTELAGSIAAITGADVRAPYGMTEVMPVTDGGGATSDRPVGTDTGLPLPGTAVRIAPFDDPSGASLPGGSWGEILVSAPWMRAGYDRRWDTDQRSTVSVDGRQFHRTGDVGLLDGDGHLVQLGRAQHVITTAEGPHPCVAIEQPVAAAIGREVAAVGIGPRHTQVAVVVVRGEGPLHLATGDLTDSVRRSSPIPIAAVLTGELPVDIRHQSKVRREALARAATELLEGR